jgi:hypothetical protein
VKKHWWWNVYITWKIFVFNFFPAHLIRRILNRRYNLDKNKKRTKVKTSYEFIHIIIKNSVFAISGMDSSSKNINRIFICKGAMT